MSIESTDNTFWRGYFKFTGFIEKVIEWFSAIAFFGIVTATILQVFFRFVLNSPRIWTEELARYLGVFVIMIATANALKNNQHIGIDVFSSKLPAPAQKPLKVFYSLVIIGVMGFLAIYTIVLAQLNFNIPTPAMRIPMGIPYTGMAIGCTMSTLSGVFTLIETLFYRGKKGGKAA